MAVQEITDEETATSVLSALKERREELIRRRDQLHEEFEQMRANLEKEIERLRGVMNDEFEQFRDDLDRALSDIKALGQNNPVNMTKAAEIMGVSRQRLNQMRRGLRD